MADTQNLQRQVAPVEAPIQFDRAQFSPLLVEVDLFLRVSQARESFVVNGSGLTVAVLDTGLRPTHIDFAGRIPTQRNFTTDNEGNAEDASDGNGHGTNVGGIIVANGNHRGIAPGANIIPLKVLSNNGGGSFEAIDNALKWVIENRARYNITAVCMSLGDSGNYTTDEDLVNDAIRLKIQKLREAKVAVVVAAGNDFFNHASQQGMGYPAIIRETVSVGAVYDANEGAFEYRSGAKAFSTGPGQITPFSQRLHPSVNGRTRTDIFAPGAPVTSSGINNDRGESVQHGTSQATPVTAGVILLMQQFHLRETNTLPAVNELATWLRAGGVVIRDGDDENDNVINTGLDFLRIDALTALDAVKRHLRKRLFYELMLLVK